jgi:D-alanine-D-alanine ligase-like ATP-grasp enzyme/acylphosphatase
MTATDGHGGPLTVDRVRFLVVDRDAESGASGRTREVIAHASGVVGDVRVSAMGRRSVGQDHAALRSWDVLEDALASVRPIVIPLESHRAGLGGLRAASRELERQVALAADARSADDAGSVREQVRREVRRIVRRTLGAGIAEAFREAVRGLIERARSTAVTAAPVADDGCAALTELYDTSAVRIRRYICWPPPPPPTLDGRMANTYEDVTYIRHLPKDGTKGHLLERESLRYGLDSLRFAGGSFVVRDRAGGALNFKWGRSPISSGVALSVCTYKEATRTLLTRSDVPVPEGRAFPAGAYDEAMDFADVLGYPVVCKPVAGLRGIGVVADIRHREQLRDALELLGASELGGDDFVVERHHTGSDYRIVVIGGRIVAAVLREPASVIGTGRHNVADLIEYKNRIRAANPHLRRRPIVIGAPLTYQLSKAGLSLASVPAPGQRVTLANSANLSQGGDSFEVAQQLHPTIRDAALRAVEAVPGLGFCGLDMLLEDHRRPLDEQSAVVIELNAHAAIGSAQYPMWGHPVPVAEEFFLECARAHDIEILDEPADGLAVQATVRGRVTGVGYRRWLQRRATEYGVAGWVENHPRGRVVAHLEGPADAVAALAYLCVDGPRTALPSSVTTVHVPKGGMDAFVVLE